MGNVISTGLGQAPARQAALQSGLPQTVPCTVVNKVCASGLKAVMMAAQAVRCGAVQLVLAGGMESMSNVPHHLPSSRRGRRLGNMPLVDTLLTDGLTDSCGGGCWHMGRCADLCAQQHQISRSSQDDYAVESFRRAAAAASSGVTSWETASVPLPLAGRRGTVELVRDDEVPLKLDEAKLRRLPAAFAEPGPAAEHAVTAGNASALADGAAAVLLASTSYAERHGLPVLAHVEGMADAAQHPHWYTTAPELAARRALAAAGRAAADIDVWEVNEAFAVVALVNQQLLSVDVERLNVLGGSIALGHPIGASGARILVTLLNALRVRRGTLGVASICNGGGGASSVVVRAGPDLYSYTPPYASASQQLPCRPPAQ